MYIPKHFKLSELIHPDILTRYGSSAWELLDERMLKVIDFLRDGLGSCIINNHYYVDSGLRADFGSITSMHRNGNAYDLKFMNKTTAEAHDFIKEHQEELYELGLRRVEHISATPTWTHIDGKPAPMAVLPKKIYFFRP